MTRAWVLGVAAALAGAGLTLAQEVQPSAPPAPPPPDAPVAVVAVPPPSDAPPPEEAAPPPRMEHAPVVAASDDDKDEDTPAPPPPPLKRPRFASAILQGVDKITAETYRFEAKVGQPVRYKGLILTVHACESTAADESDPDSWAHLEVVSQPRTAPGRPTPLAKQVFRGWMSASSPSLHPFEHAGYDLWLIACRTAAPDTPPAGQT